MVFTETLESSQYRIAAAWEKWKFALIGKFLGRKRMDIEFVGRVLARKWHLCGELDVIVDDGEWVPLKLLLPC